MKSISSKFYLNTTSAISFILLLFLLINLHLPMAWATDVQSISIGEQQALWLRGGHTGDINSLAVAPDGRSVASASNDNTIKIWRLADGMLQRTLCDHTGGVLSVAYSPDGTLLASGGKDSLVKIWRVGQSGVDVRTLSGHLGAVKSVAFSPDGSTLASAGEDGAVKLWRVSDGALLRTINAHTGSVNTVAFSPDGKLLATGGADEKVCLWRVDSGECLFTLPGHIMDVVAVAFSPDGSYLASGGDWSVRIWRTSDGSLFKKIQISNYNFVKSLAWSPKGDCLAVGLSGGKLQFWFPLSDAPCTQATVHKHSVSALAFTPDGESLVTAGGETYDESICLKVLEIEGATIEEKIITGHCGKLSAVAIARDGSMAASTGYDKTVRLWQGGTGQPVTTLVGPQNWLNAVEISPDGKLVAAGGWDNLIWLWQIPEGALVRKLPGHTGQVCALAFAPDGTLLASGGWDKTVRVWRVSDGAPLLTLPAQDSWLYSLAFSPDGNLLASGGSTGLVNGIVKVWRIKDGTLLREFPVSMSAVTAMSFSPDGKMLAAGTSGGRVVVYRIDNGSRIRELVGPGGEVYWIGFSSDGMRLAAVFPGSVRVWDLSEGEELGLCFFGQDVRVKITDAALSADWRLLVWGREDATILAARDPLPFTCADTTPPAVIESDPPNGATTVPVNKIITLRFSEEVFPGETFQNIALIEQITNSSVAAEVYLEGAVLSIRPTEALRYGTTYTVSVPAGAVKDATGNVFASPYSFSFTTVAAPSSTLSLEVPAVEGSPGERVSVPLNLNSNGEVAGVQVELVYDPALLQFREAVPGQLTGGWMVSARLIQPGRVRLLVTHSAGQTVPAGYGSVALLQFDVPGGATPGNRCDLSLENTVVSSAQGTALPVTVKNGSFAVISEPPRELSLPPNTATAPGQVVNLPVSISEARNVSGFDFTLSYDPALLGQPAVEAGALLTGRSWQVTGQVGEPGSYRVIGYSATGEALPAGSGVLVRVTFKVAEQAKVGSKCQVSFSQAILSDSSGNSIPVTGKSGQVVVARKKGDVNGDGRIDVLDVVRAVNIALGRFAPGEEEKSAADANGDGQVNVLDVVRIVNIALGRA